VTDHLVTSIVTVLTAVVGVAIIAVIFSKQSNTASVLTSGGNAFAAILKAATNVGGGSFTGGGVSLPTIQ
jgi:hypothetical protein